MSSKPTDRHHIIPRVVCRMLRVNPNFSGNVIKVKTTKHRAWHTLFGAATPEEAIEIIRNEWSLSEAGEAEFKRLTTVRLFRRRNR
jgi:hypothetical protein